MTFVDTSAIYAFVDGDDANHPAADRAFRALAESSETLVTHNYVVVESIALIQRRLGVHAVRRVVDEMLPVFDQWWVDEEAHARAVHALLAANRRAISLVDWTSFVLLRDRGIDRVFTFDTDFAGRGLEVIPPLHA